MLTTGDPLEEASTKDERSDTAVDPVTGEIAHVVQFIEEPVGIPAQQGVGYLQINFGETVCDGRYTILRKLGWGQQASIWLVLDSTDQKYYAMKALTGWCTARQTHWELDAYQALASLGPVPHMLHLKHHWIEPGRGSAGDHLCLVTQLLGGDLAHLTAQDTREERWCFALNESKHLLRHVLLSISVLHSRGIMHGDIKVGNIFYDLHLTEDEISDWLLETPPLRQPAQPTPDGYISAAASQPLPPPPLNLSQLTFLLGDLGSAIPRAAREANQDKLVTICPLPLRPPEIYLQGPWDEKVDIWMFGCLVYEFITNMPLFLYYENGATFLGQTLDAVPAMLFQMMTKTDETYTKEQLQISAEAPLFFESNCLLRNVDQLLEIGRASCRERVSQLV